MKTRKHLLDDKLQKEYIGQWNKFKEKYKVNNSYNVHNGLPVISEVFQFQNYPIFRAHVFGKKLRSFDPYLISEEKHLNPYWHLMHYQMSVEQLYHASIKHFRDTNKYHAKEVPINLKLHESILWNENISIELILINKKKTKKYLVEECYYTFFNEKDNKVKASILGLAFVEQRAFVKDIENLDKGKDVIDGLIRKIEWQNIRLKKLKNPRKKLLMSKEELINELKNKNIPRKELCDFFSYWDLSGK